MSAEPLPPLPEREPGSDPFPSWLYAPPGGWTVDDLDRLPPDSPRRVEVIDGAPIFMSPQAKFHSRVIFGLRAEFKRLAPTPLRADSEMTIRVHPQQGPEPDVLLVSTEAYEHGGLKQTWYKPGDVTLVVEVVSPDSELRDRKRKPQIYAEAGIRHFWRIENEDDRAVAYVYELDAATATYALTGIFHDELKVAVPFPMAIDLDALTA